MNNPSTFTFAQQSIHRLGYGAMKITGPGVWGYPPDREGALAVLRRAVELGVDFIDTADSYGPYVSEELIFEAFTPTATSRSPPKLDWCAPGLTRGSPWACRNTCARSARCRFAASVWSPSTSFNCTVSIRA